jgi:hypothetical protein
MVKLIDVIVAMSKKLDLNHPVLMMIILLLLLMMMMMQMMMMNDFDNNDHILSAVVSYECDIRSTYIVDDQNKQLIHIFYSDDDESRK